MKIKAYQIAPEYQESPLYLFDEVPEGLEIFGNKDYKRRTSETFDKVLECLDYGDFSDFGFTGHKADRLGELCNKYYTHSAVIVSKENIFTNEKSAIASWGK